MASERPAHTDDHVLRVREYYPAHEPRQTDSHYHLFNEARRRLQAAGKLVCWVCGKDAAAAGAPIELHHATVEYALQNGVDIHRFAEKFPDLHVADDESFFRFVEGEGNLTALCVFHHRGAGGIHAILYSPWVAQAFWREDLPAPAVAVSADRNADRDDGSRQNQT